LEAVYDVSVEKVHTINYMGQKKMRADSNGRPFFVRLQDWKKAYVIFKHPAAEMQQQQRALLPSTPAAPSAALPEGAAVAAARRAEPGAEAAGAEAGAAAAQQGSGAAAAAVGEAAAPAAPAAASNPVK
jgi:hypothetical protein